MELRPFIEEQLAQNYRALDGLVDLLTDDDLDWRPTSGSNWMTVGQLLEHLAGCGGASFRAIADGTFATMPAEVTDNPEAGLPPAEAFESVTSMDEAREKLAADRALAEEVLAAATDEELQNEPAPVWWDPRDTKLGMQFVYTIQHLNQHKGQLFYYLKLMGRDVGTAHLWGM